MKKTISISIFAIAFILLSANVFPACLGCLNTLSSCVNSKGGSVTFPVMHVDQGNCGSLPPIVVKASASANGCVTAYNNCVTNQNCTCYPFAVLQVSTPSMRRTVVVKKR